MNTHPLCIKSLLIALLLGGIIAAQAGNPHGAPNKPQKPNHGNKHKGNASNSQPQRVQLNHKGHIISVSEHAVQAHLNHGDTLVDDSGPTPEAQPEPGSQ